MAKTTRLKQLLKNRRMTQKELSVKSDVAEYKISLLCSGKSQNLHILTAKKICEVLNCTLDDAFGDILY